VAELPRLDYLGGSPADHHLRVAVHDGVLNRDARDGCLKELAEEEGAVDDLLKALLIRQPFIIKVKPADARVAEKGAGWVSDQQVPAGGEVRQDVPVNVRAGSWVEVG
jgi:hypothetical protein